MEANLFDLLDNLPNSSGISKEVHQELVKLYKAMRRIKGAVVDINEQLTVSAQPTVGVYRVICAGIPVTVNGDFVNVNITT